MMLSAQAAPAGPAGIALLGVRNRLHFTLTALAKTGTSRSADVR